MRDWRTIHDDLSGYFFPLKFYSTLTFLGIFSRSLSCLLTIAIYSFSKNVVQLFSWGDISDSSLYLLCTATGSGEYGVRA